MTFQELGLLGTFIGGMFVGGLLSFFILMHIALELWLRKEKGDE